MPTQQQQRAPHYEFMGPIGVTMIMSTLPLMVYFLYFACNSNACLSLDPTAHDYLKIDLTPFQNGFAALVPRLFSMQVASLYLGWFILQAILYKIVPGQVVKGTPLDESGTRLSYPVNGLSSGIIGAGIYITAAYLGVFPSTIVYDEYLAFITIGVIFTLSFTLFLYLHSRFTDHNTPQTKLSEHGNTGNPMYDMWMGRTLNPRMLGIDWKYFCELRPGLVGWCLINLSMAARQYKDLGEVTPSLILVIIFQFIYVLDALASEQAILTTMDITSDGFGYMLAFGDLCWVPLTYSLQARYLVDHPTYLSSLNIGIILLIQITGLAIFRTANNQKNEFRTNSNSDFSRKALYIQTEKGTKLLLSGWWGRARHANYFGDLLIGLSWCLPCGFNHVLPYFYSVYFTVLLVHRERRDDTKCHNKYGKDWEKYCKQVPYRIVPYIY